MKLDFINISLIKEFYNLKPKEIIELSKIRDRILPNSSKIEKKKRLDNLRDRLMAMPRDLFKVYKNNGKNVYELIIENVKFGKFKFPDGIKDGIALRINGRWAVSEV